MGYYSIQAISPGIVGVAEPLIALDRGFNVFTAQTDDLDGLLAHLKAEGVEIRQVNRLDEHEPVAPEDSILLPGETPEGLLPSPSETDP